jgi:hypothetical protein
MNLQFFIVKRLNALWDLICALEFARKTFRIIARFVAPIP